MDFFEAIGKGCVSNEYLKLKEAWKRLADEADKHFYYYVKSAYIKFEFNGNSYFVGAGSLDVSNELFERIELDIEADLQKIGAERICYCGMID